MPTHDEMIRLCAGRWQIPLLALASASEGFRFAEAVRRLGLARGVARASLDALIEEGWLARNPGHGHPLRPEYVLTAEGRDAGKWSEAVMRAREELGLAPDALTRWSLPLLVVLAHGEARFGALAENLAPVTPRALSLTLKAALAAALVTARPAGQLPAGGGLRADRAGPAVGGGRRGLTAYPASRVRAVRSRSCDSSIAAR